MPAEDGSEGAVGSSSFAIPSLWLWEMIVRLVVRSCSLLGCHREEDKKGWMIFPVFLGDYTLTWHSFLVLPHILLLLP